MRSRLTDKYFVTDLAFRFVQADRLAKKNELSWDDYCNTAIDLMNAAGRALGRDYAKKEKAAELEEQKWADRQQRAQSSPHTPSASSTD